MANEEILTHCLYKPSTCMVQQNNSWTDVRTKKNKLKSGLKVLFCVITVEVRTQTPVELHNTGTSNQSNYVK